MNEDFLTQEQFMYKIECIMKEKSINHIDAILEFCVDHQIDVEEIIPLVSRPLKEKIKVDAMELGMMKKEATLPI